MVRTSGFRLRALGLRVLSRNEGFGMIYLNSEI